MELANIRYNISKKVSQIVAMRGINYSHNISDGDLAECENLSARQFPNFTTRKKREKQTATSVTAVTGGDALITVRTDESNSSVGKLYYGDTHITDSDGEDVLKSGEKLFAKVNTKLCIFPDKKYVDTSEIPMILKDMAPEIIFYYRSSTTTTINHITFSDGNKLTVSERFNIADTLKVGDKITISGIKDVTLRENNITTTVKEIGKIYDPTLSSSQEYIVVSGTFVNGSFNLDREVEPFYINVNFPNLDYICESQNRLWGVDNSTGTVYASELGDPLQFYVFDGLSTDSYQVAVGSDGDFTGICKLSNSVLCWKENTLHKILGSYPSEYAMYTYELDGVQKGSYKSMATINDVLYYKGNRGIYAYSGGTPVILSDNFGERRYIDAVGGADNNTYYISMKDSNNSYHLYLYKTNLGIWVREDSTQAVDFARIGEDLYYADSNGDVYLETTDEEDPDIEWSAQFTPFYDSVIGKRSYQRIYIRLNLPKGSYVIAEIKADDGVWKQVGKIIGKGNNVSVIQIPTNRCNKFEVRLKGKGNCTILNVLREYAIWSVK